MSRRRAIHPHTLFLFLFAELSVPATTSSASSSSSLRLPIPAFPPRVVITPTRNNSMVQAAGPPADYHSESAESMDEIPVAQTRLGSSTPNGVSKGSAWHLPFPAAHSRGEGETRQTVQHKSKRKNILLPTGQWKEELELSPKIPAMFVSKSSGEPPVPNSWSGKTSEPPHRKCSSKRHVDDLDRRVWDPSTSSTVA